MVNAVEFIIGLAIGTGIISIYYFVRMRRGSGDVARHRVHFQRAVTMCGMCAVLAVIGEVVLRLR
jgi:hypothetical protein